MELIKQIKQAEAQAQEIIEKARVEAVKQADAGRRKRQAAIDQAEQERKRAMEAAVAQARSQGQAEVEGLKTEAEKRRRQLRDDTHGKMSAAVEKVVNYLKGQ